MAIVDYTSRYANIGTMQRRSAARGLLDTQPGVLHVVVGYYDSDRCEIPTFIVFDDENEWNAWVSLYQGVGGFIDACHTQNPIY